MQKWPKMCSRSINSSLMQLFSESALIYSLRTEIHLLPCFLKLKALVIGMNTHSSSGGCCFVPGELLWTLWVSFVQPGVILTISSQTVPMYVNYMLFSVKRKENVKGSWHTCIQRWRKLNTFCTLDSKDVLGLLQLLTQVIVFFCVIRI